jgi:hypothetical protein
MRSDAALLAAARTDAGAFRELYDRYAERVLGYHHPRCRARARPPRPCRPAQGEDPMTARLTAIGDDLERATRRELRGRVRRRRIVIGAVAAAFIIPGGALAASLLTPGDVAQSMPAGTKFLVGTTPTCTEVKAGVEYHCTIAGDFKAEVADLKGTVEPTVDTSKHVNGGCRSLRSDGREWECYIGREAVKQQIIGKDFLGEYAPSPGVG